MNARRSRERRRQRRERREALERGDVQPTRDERIEALKRKRDGALAGVNREYVEARNELEAQFAQSKKAIWDDFHASVKALDVGHSGRSLDEILVPAAGIDLDEAARELERVTGVKLPGRRGSRRAEATA